MEEVNFIAKYHSPLRKWLDCHPQNVSYLSHVSQNEMLSILSRAIEDTIRKEIQEVKYFSVECDEVTSHLKTYMSVIVRYVHECSIEERCLKLVAIDSLKGKSLADVIVGILEEQRLPIIDLIGKGFDGVSNMSGKDNGVQHYLTEAGAEKSTYFHCFA